MDPREDDGPENQAIWMKHGFKVKSQSIQAFENQKLGNELELLLKAERVKKCELGGHKHKNRGGILTKGQFSKIYNHRSGHYNCFNINSSLINDKIWLRKANPSVFKQMKEAEDRDLKVLQTRRHSYKLL